MIDTPPFDATWFRLMTGLIIGLCFGSFITMLSYRLPRRLSLSHPPRSFCPSCKTLLKPIDLMPIASWAMTGGQCRYCHTKIGVRYPLIELASGISFMIVFAVIGFQWALLPVMIVLTAVIIAVTIQIEKH